MSEQFTKQEFFDWLGQWHRLSDWQLKTVLAVASVKADEQRQDHQQPVVEHLEAIQKQSKPATQSRRKAYSDDEMLDILNAAEKWDQQSKNQRRLWILAIAAKYGRTYKAIDRQIYRARFSK